jgi:hypothetical protein
MPGDDAASWLARPYCVKSKRHAGYHRTIFDGVAYDWPPDPAPVTDADKP